MDINIAAFTARGADIAVYFAASGVKGYADVFLSAIYDEVNKPSVLSVSWGSSEAEWAVLDMQNISDIFSEAAAMGVTIVVASGDDGASCAITQAGGFPAADGLAHVFFPASSPWVTSCGGTYIKKQWQAKVGEFSDAGYQYMESTWNDKYATLGSGGYFSSGGATGGGYSQVFARQPWQTIPNNNNSTNRGVPDIAGNASPYSGHLMTCFSPFVAAGTSAVAPLYAGLAALIKCSINAQW